MENHTFIKFLVGRIRGSIIVVSEFKYSTLRFGLGVKVGFFVGGALNMHNLLGLCRVEHLHLGG